METLRYVVLANGLLAVVSFAYYVLLRRETFFETNRLVLWLGLTASLVLPLLELPDWRPQPVRKVMQQTAQAIVPKILPAPATPVPEVTITFPNGRTYPAFTNRVVETDWSWQQALIAFYVAVLLGLLVQFCLRLTSLLRLIRRSTHELYDGFTLVKNNTVTSPFSFFGWVVLNPVYHEADELEQILRHERVHVRAWHSIDMIGAELVRIIFWFNPAAHLFRQLIHQTLEFSADRAVLAEGVDAKSYQYNLMKVSLSVKPSVISNHFSQSQLKSRIFMMNQRNSSRSTWLKYPALCIAALTVATTFARPHINKLRKNVPTRVSKTKSVVPKAVKTLVGQAMLVEQLAENKAMGQATNPVGTNAAQPLKPSPKAVLMTSSVKSKDPIRLSPSRYMTYKGNYLYWVITSKTTFDDFGVMRQELAKYDCQLQLNEIKYDPLFAYIDRIMVTMTRKTGNRTQSAQLDDDQKPIKTIAGYIGIEGEQANLAGSSRLESRYDEGFPMYQTEAEKNFPELLRKVAADDEAVISQHIAGKKMEYLVLTGEREYGHLGMGFRKFDKKEVTKEAKHGSFIEINPDESLSVDKAKNFTKVFINNKPVSHEDIRRIKINQLYTVAVVLGYDNSAQKRSGTDYLLFYVNED